MERFGNTLESNSMDKPLEPAPTTSSTASKQADVNTAKPSQELNPALLSGLPLAYALLLSNEESELFGSPTTFFAFFNESKMRLHVIGGNESNVHFHTVESDIIPIALSETQKLGGTFIVHHGEVLCNIDGISASGSSYGEAAMRALVLFNQARS